MLISPNILSPFLQRIRGGEARFSSAEIGNVADDTVVVRFSRQINSPGDDYALGVTITKNAVGQTISSATLQGDGRTVHYVLAAAAEAGDALTWAYDAGGGDWVTVKTGNALASVAARAVTNTLVESEPFPAGILDFTDPLQSGHIVTSGA